MSYSFGMFFKQVNNADEAMEIMNKVAQILITQAKDYIHDNRYCIPSVDNKKYMPETDRYWLYSLFTLKFTYWKDEKLFALSGLKYPKEIEKLFDTYVYFQNGTDQDYLYKEWSNKISVFKEEKAKTKLITSKEIYSRFDVDKNNKNTTNAARYKRQALYENIFDRLELDFYINGCHEKTSTFKVFSVCAINDIYTLSELSALIRYYYSREYKEE